MSITNGTPENANEHKPFANVVIFRDTDGKLLSDFCGPGFSFADEKDALAANGGRGEVIATIPVLNPEGDEIFISLLQSLDAHLVWAGGPNLSELIAGVVLLGYEAGAKR